MTLLNIPLLTEPDKQRYAQFVMKALHMLDVSLFHGAARLPVFMQSVPLKAMTDSVEHYNLQLFIKGKSLYLGVFIQAIEQKQYSTLLVTLEDIPSSEQLNHIKDTLKAESEVSDPELLRLHNELIQKEMAQAQQRAAAELQELETKLDQKRTQLQESIRNAEIDSLTQIYNRGAYDRRLNEAVKYCQRQGGLLSLILLDLDYFKQVNDTLGHQAGDEVLKNMAKFMQQYTRSDVDHVCRMGGDEFAIIFFSEAQIAKRSAEKILDSMNGKVSIGIAQLTEKDSVESLIARADEALYKAKELGRGQVVLDSEIKHDSTARNP